MTNNIVAMKKKNTLKFRTNFCDNLGHEYLFVKTSYLHRNKAILIKFADLEEYEVIKSLQYFPITTFRNDAIQL